MKQFHNQVSIEFLVWKQIEINMFWLKIQIMMHLISSMMGMGYGLHNKLKIRNVALAVVPVTLNILCLLA